jgi:TetR/AcrR family transcriptional repressor of nem operon
MPRVSRAGTELNRTAIEDASSRLFRERGLGVSVSDVMAAAGLTHGGFYGHFESKDALAATACARAFDESLERWHKRLAGKTGRAASLAALVEGYLSPRNRSTMGSGCPMAGFATDVAREPDDKPIRKSYVDGLGELLGVLAGVQDTGDTAQDRHQALGQLSTMVGAMVLARATRGDPLSNELMAAAKERLLQDRAPLQGAAAQGRAVTQGN